MTHHIRQYHLHLTLNGTEADGLALQSQLTGFCYDHLLPALARVLDRYAPANEHLALDCLEIEAGVLTLDQLEQDAPAAVAQALEKALHEQTTRLHATPSATTHAKLQTTSQTVEEAFLYFLNTGRLPWAFRLPEGRTLEQVVNKTWAAMTGPDAIPWRVREPLRRALASPAARQRLIWQFSLGFREKLLTAFWPASQRLWENIRVVLHHESQAVAPVPEAARAGFEHQVWESILAHLTDTSVLSVEEIIGETWRQLPTSAQQPALANLLEQTWPRSTQAQPLNPVPQSPQAKRLETPATEVTEAIEGYYLDNAGLVLLHPFLPRFFEGLGIAEHTQLLQPERALSLLHFLATGQHIAPEHALTLPKLLCALPLAQPVAADVALTVAETDEAEALLQAVVRHWSALRSTSPDGLRGTFLARAGKLSLRADGDWLLQVEPMSYDILLDQLPWGISMIQLPWMPRMLRVEWG